LKRFWLKRFKKIDRKTIIRISRHRKGEPFQEIAVAT